MYVCMYVHTYVCLVRTLVGSFLALTYIQITSFEFARKQMHPHARTSSMARKKTVVFLHPDLGIGGAERLVVDAAVALQERGHKVVLFTSHCDAAHCFDEARDGS